MNISTLSVWGGFGALSIGLLILLKPILLPFVMSFAVAYLLNPLINKMEKKLSRGLASFLVLFIFIVAVSSLGFLLYPLLQTQFLEFIHWIPQVLKHFQNYFNTSILPHFKSFFTTENIPQILEKSFSSLGETLTLFGQLISQILISGAAIFNLLSLLFITPIVAFYLLREWPHIVAFIDQWIPRQNLENTRKILSDIDKALSGFIRGQLSVCLVLAIYYGIGLTLIGLKFGLIIGFLTGFLSFIPFFGFLVGCITSFLIAFFQFTSIGPFIGLGFIFAIGQLAENYYLFPVFVGEKVHLHPVWMIFALLAFSSLFGFLGALLAIPLAAILGVLIRFSLDKYFKSYFYLK
jgi:predicted PurR-regulated permease PerM